MNKFFKDLPEEFFYKAISSPVGKLHIICSKKHLYALLFSLTAAEKAMIKAASKKGCDLIGKVETQLSEYFSGKRKRFQLPLHSVGTDFQKRSWKALTTIPYGKTISYQEQAIKLGEAKLSRAVGMANGKNPISIIVPCHRVIGKNGKLTGFGGGLNTKSYLLDLEKDAARP